MRRDNKFQFIILLMLYINDLAMSLDNTGNNLMKLLPI